MQATVHRFDPNSGSGEVIRDDGTLVHFAPSVFAASGLRHLRVGQRLSLDIDSTYVTDPENDSVPQVLRMWIVGIGDDQTIA